MTKPQIWVSAFLFLFILLFILGKVTKEDKTETDFPVNNSPGVEETNNEITGVQLFVNFGCTKCHGENLSGTVNGPTTGKPGRILQLQFFDSICT